jgi:protoporphyrinogen oxidase
MTVYCNVFVIGAGPAGLTAAYCLSRQRQSVIVIEKDPIYVGGISRTVSYKGFLFDIGGHRFFSKSKEVVDLWCEILPDGFIERRRLSRIFYRGKFYSYPLNALEAWFNLGPIESTRCILSFLKARAFPIHDPQTFHDWVRNEFGERLFSIFFKTYTEKVWGMSCDEISADWAAQRIKGLDLTVALKNALKRSFGATPTQASGRRDDVVKTLIETFRYPRKGPGMMWHAAAQKIIGYGGQVLMARNLTALSYDKQHQRWYIQVTGSTGPEYYVSRHVISSAPLGELMEKIEPQPASIFHARALRYRDFLIVAIMIGKAELFPDNWIYIHDPSVKVGRLQNYRSWSPEMTPSGTTCLGLEYFCFEGDKLWTSSDAELIALATEEAEKIGLVKATDVIDACVVRQPKAYPVYDETYRDHVRAIRDDIELSCPNLHLVGRNGMHKYNNQDHAMMTAMLTARNILAGDRSFDPWAVNEDAEYHEAGANEALASERQVPAKIRIP